MTTGIPDVIVIRGAPGAGKSRTAKALSERLGRGVRVEVDTLRSMVFPVDWTNQAEHLAALSVASSVAARFVCQGHRPVIVVDTFSGDKITKFLSELRDQCSGVDVRVFALFVEPTILRARVEGREADGYRDLRVCEKLNADVAKYLNPSERLIDNSGLTPEDTAEAVLAGCMDAEA
jgi:predicted ABC-type ATPase